MPAPRKSSSSIEKVRAHRARLRELGLRPVQVWVRDTRAPEFATNARRQARAAARADKRDPELSDFLDTALADIDAK